MHSAYKLVCLYPSLQGFNKLTKVLGEPSISVDNKIYTLSIRDYDSGIRCWILAYWWYVTCLQWPLYNSHAWVHWITIELYKAYGNHKFRLTTKPILSIGDYNCGIRCCYWLIGVMFTSGYKWLYVRNANAKCLAGPRVLT